MTATKDSHSTINSAVEHGTNLTSGHELTVSGLTGSAIAYYVASLFGASKRTILIVTHDVDTAETLGSDVAFFLGKEKVIIFPSPEILPFEQEVVHEEISAARMEALYKLAEEKACVVVTTAENLAMRLMPKKALIDDIIDLEICDSPWRDAPHGSSRDNLIDRLVGMGYKRMSMVEERGEFSVRGGILDIFPPMHDEPLRIEFDGEEVESIRSFDLTTQRSSKKIETVRILKARTSGAFDSEIFEARRRLIARSDALGLEREAWEAIASRLKDGTLSGVEANLPLFYDKLDTLFDYLGHKCASVIVSPEEVTESLERFDAEIKSADRKFVAQKKYHADPASLYLDHEEVEAHIRSMATVRIETIKTAGAAIKCESNMDLRHDLKFKKSAEHLLKPLADRLKDWHSLGHKVYITAHNNGQAERTKELLSDYGFTFPPFIQSADIIVARSSSPCIAIGNLSSGGFRLSDASLVIISEEEIFGERVKRRPPARKLEAFLTQIEDLALGDPVVHTLHGVALYRGLKRLNIDGVENDYMLLEYRDADKLYLPVWRMDLIGKYRGVGDATPELDKLGGKGWEKTRRKVKHAVEKLAGELLKLYAEREAAEGFAFSRPNHMFQEFEASFEYDETPDQARAIEDTLSDMERGRPMDRLICGDVGYGKTEVAMRAAFKATLDGKQAAMLVPTTVLAEQHFATFTKRFAPYPVTIGVLSRFKSRQEQLKTIEGLHKGEVDIVIGTHRLLQKDIGFKDLGLIVIDEEHRFGVAHKEKLKMLRKKVDCLTLTATPIPRTLHMSLASIRELSIINTPPEDRLAIKTHVAGFDEELIAEAIGRELNRGGQVFFVHNRVQNIGAMAELVARLVPKAKVAIAHGQMKEHELEKTMLGFVRKDYDVLLSTAIIESGLDIPSANTIIINRADRFGLAELYQLRGRVGRSSHRAYAYFICPSATEITPEAAKRISVLRELTEPGSGFKIASHDLEMRGAGELLGQVQSGHVAEVGFDLYTQMLEEAIAELKDDVEGDEPDPEISIALSQYIPEDYVPDVRHRLGLYKRLSSARSDEDVDEISDELEDRFGPPPATAGNLIAAMRLKLQLKRLRARELTQRGKRLYFAFGDLSHDDSLRNISKNALRLAKSDPTRFKLTPDNRLTVTMADEGHALIEAGIVLKELTASC